MTSVKVARIARNKTNKKPLPEIDRSPGTPEEDREAREALVSARVILLMKHPFFGNLATRMTLVNADSWCRTAATDGRKFYYNSRFINALDQQELVFLVAHEVLHVVYDHIGRREERDPRLSNVAADFAVNGDLVKHNIGRMITTVECLYDEKYVGWAYERIYEDLLENADEMDIEDYVSRLLDEHMRNENLSEEERQRIRDEIREAVLSAARAETNPGNLPQGVRQMIQHITDPKISWQELLPQTLQSAFRSDYTWMRPSRRGWHGDAILPGTDREKDVDIVLFADASGSCTEMLPDFLGMVRGVMEQFKSFRVHLMTFDTEIYNPQVFTPENISDITDYEVMGGGGTLFQPIWDYLKDNDIQPEKLVILTDMGACDSSWKSEENYADTLWIVHSTQIEPPFGTWAYYESP